jgi:TolA-binding protein
MIRFDLHPEDLLERERRGTANAAELTRLALHVAECSVCRVERALVAQAALDAAPLRDEQLLVARLKRGLAARLAAPARRHSKRKGASVAVALAAVTVASVAAAATFVIVRDAAAPQAIVTAPPGQPPPAPAPAAPRHRSAPAPDEPRRIAAGEIGVAEPSSKQGEPAVARSAARAAVEPASASELFSRANQARRDGKATEAVRLYRALQERFSGTNEELVSRVTLGRLLLDRLGDSRGALVQFNSYLASPGGGVLREEAMVGRALSLGRMGRAAEERAAWQALLDTFPKSTQRKRAQARLVELGGSSPFAVRTGPGVGRAGGAQ